jgi:hypothetical protein
VSEPGLALPGHAATPWHGTSQTDGLRAFKPYRWRGRADFLTPARMAEIRGRRDNSILPSKKALDAGRKTSKERSVKRHETFFELVDLGCSVHEAASVVGVSYGTGKRWERERKRGIYRERDDR